MNIFKTIIIFALLFVFGCNSSEYIEKQKALKKAAVIAVQKSNGNYPNIDTTASIALLLTLIENEGKYVKIDGWDCIKGSDDSSFDVWFRVSVNDVLKEFHWVVTSDEIIPANDLAQSVTKRQKFSM